MSSVCSLKSFNDLLIPLECDRGNMHIERALKNIEFKKLTIFGCSFHLRFKDKRKHRRHRVTRIISRGILLSRCVQIIILYSQSNFPCVIGHSSCTRLGPRRIDQWLPLLIIPGRPSFPNDVTFADLTVYLIIVPIFNNVGAH